METRSRNSVSAQPPEQTPIDIPRNQNNDPIGNGHPSSASETHNDIPTDSADSSTPSKIQNGTSTEPRWSPSLQLLEGRKEKHKLCVGLFKAAVNGDANEAKSLFKDYPESMLLRVAITEKHETVLHVAAGAKQTLFVEEMIKLMGKGESWTLKLQNRKGNNAFCYAAMAGSTPIVKAMLKKDKSLLKIRGAENTTPLYLAALFGQRDMALYLYEEMKIKFKEELKVMDRRTVFFRSICNTLYGLALELLRDDKDNELAMGYYSLEEDESAVQTPLHRLAQTPLHLLDQASKTDKPALLSQALELIELLWEKILNSEGAQVWQYFEGRKDLLFDAAELGNFKFLEKLIHLYPDLVHLRDAENRTIFHIAIMRRHDNIFRLIEKISFNKQLIEALDQDGNSLLHLAATYPNPRPVGIVPGAALEMRHELRIFMDVESLLMPSFRELKNKKGYTPRELFSTTHADLLEKGERWMRNTASQCMIVATIIATVVFAAAFSVPGGNDDDGIPNHWNNIVFKNFAVSDAVALSSCSISILMFLSILTSRYAENDFYRSLPLKLVVGLLSLSISMAAMILCFISSVFLAYNDHRSNSIPLLRTIFVFLPVFVFGWSQYDLLRDTLLVIWF